MARNSKSKLKQVIESKEKTSEVAIAPEIIGAIEKDTANTVDLAVKNQEAKVDVASSNSISHNVMTSSNGGFGDKLVRNFI